jgi:preprotein translocase YajC subunit
MSRNGWDCCLLLAEQGNAGWQGLLFGTPLIPVLVTALLYYWLMIRPGLEKQKESQKLIEQLKKNDAVITAGGICGTVVQATPGSRFITIRVDDTNNTRLRVLRSAVIGCEAGTDAAENDTASA